MKLIHELKIHEENLIYKYIKFSELEKNELLKQYFIRVILVTSQN